MVIFVAVFHDILGDLLKRGTWLAKGLVYCGDLHTNCCKPQKCQSCIFGSQTKFVILSFKTIIYSLNSSTRDFLFFTRVLLCSNVNAGAMHLVLILASSVLGLKTFPGIPKDVGPAAFNEIFRTFTLKFSCQTSPPPPYVFHTKSARQQESI